MLATAKKGKWKRCLYEAIARKAWSEFNGDNDVLARDIRAYLRSVGGACVASRQTETANAKRRAVLACSLETRTLPSIGRYSALLARSRSTRCSRTQSTACQRRHSDRDRPVDPDVLRRPSRLRICTSPSANSLRLNPGHLLGRSLSVLPRLVDDRVRQQLRRLEVADCEALKPAFRIARHPSLTRRPFHCPASMRSLPHWQKSRTDTEAKSRSWGE